MIAGVPVVVDASPVVYRFADPARGELRRPVASVPPISVRFDGRAGVRARGGPDQPRVRACTCSRLPTRREPSPCRLTVPKGLTADSATRRVALAPFGQATMTFHVRGTLPAGDHQIQAVADERRGALRHRLERRSSTGTSGRCATTGTRPCRSRRWTAALPRNPRIAYLQGVGDNVGPLLAPARDAGDDDRAERLRRRPISRAFGAIVVGPRAFAASPALVGDGVAPARVRARGGHRGRAVRPAGDAGARAPAVPDHARAARANG